MITLYLSWLDSAHTFYRCSAKRQLKLLIFNLKRAATDIAAKCMYEW
jgi:hypothetical protein